MDTSKILTDLRSERNRIDQAIAALEALNGTRASTHTTRRSFASTAPATKPTRRRKSRLTPAGRKRLSENMKKRWAERRKKAKGA
jgi:hypothetical protein